MKIEDLTDIRPGDTVTFVRYYEGHAATVTGEVWQSKDHPNQLAVGPYAIQDAFGELTGTGRGITSVDRPVTVPTGRYAVVVDSAGYGYVRDERHQDYPWDAGEETDADVLRILEDGGRIVFEGED